ncbi:MAG: hypothetical protein EOP08_14770, partial [Proteobacteria bacterium]
MPASGGSTCRRSDTVELRALPASSPTSMLDDTVSFEGVVSVTCSVSKFPSSSVIATWPVSRLATPTGTVLGSSDVIAVMVGAPPPHATKNEARTDATKAFMSAPYHTRCRSPPCAYGARAAPKDGMSAVASNESLVVAKQDPPKPGFVGAVMEVVNSFLDADGMTQAAAIAFYTGLAITPMLTLAVWIAQVFLGAEAKQEVFGVFQQVLGAAAAAPIQQLLEPAGAQAEGAWNLTG